MSPTDDLARRRREATALFKLGMKASAVGIHRTLNRPPKGKGWVQCVNSPAGVMCRPQKVREAIGYYERAYVVLPDIAVLNQIALSYEMLGELDQARQRFEIMKQQAVRENLLPYVQAAAAALQRAQSPRTANDEA